QIGSRITAAQAWVEFDAVDDVDRVVQEHVFGTEITVAVDREERAPVEKIAMRTSERVREAAEGSGARPLRAGPQRCNRLEGSADRDRRSVRLGFHMASLAVKLRDRAGDAIDLPGRDRTA